jgi:hypothetical protein
VALEVSLVARRYNRSPVADRMLDTALAVSAALGWT